MKKRISSIALTWLYVNSNIFSIFSILTLQNKISGIEKVRLTEKIFKCIKTIFNKKYFIASFKIILSALY